MAESHGRSTWSLDLAIMKRSLSLVADLVAVTALGVSILTTLLFLGAHAPGDSGRLFLHSHNACDSMPGNWEAGFYGAGKCFRWHLISRHPLEFAISLIVVIGAGYTLNGRRIRTSGSDV
jgi:hypothetical protein